MLTTVAAALHSERQTRSKPSRSPMHTPAVQPDQRTDRLGRLGHVRARGQTDAAGPVAAGPADHHVLDRAHRLERPAQPDRGLDVVRAHLREPRRIRRGLQGGRVGELGDLGMELRHRRGSGARQRPDDAPIAASMRAAIALPVNRPRRGGARACRA